MERLHIMPQNIVKENSVEQRGKRAKFWFEFLNRDDGRWLFKQNSADNTCEDIGEILYYEICRQVGLPCAEYHLASFVENGVEVHGVITKDYNPKKYVEISGATLLIGYRNFIYDNENGKEIGIKNTLHSYEAALNNLKQNNSEIEIDESCMMQLKKMCLIDYLTGQMDRHAYNVTFLVNEEGKLIPAQIYDNGNCFRFNRSTKYLQTMAEQSVKTQKPYGLLENLFKRSAPMLGVSTCTICDEYNQASGAWTMIPKEGMLETFEEELAELVLQNPELQSFFINKIYGENVVGKACDVVNFGEDRAYLKKDAQFIFTTRVERLSKLLQKHTENYLQEKEGRAR